MKKIYDVVATIGTYKNRDGEEKKRYLTVGAVFENERGMAMKLDALPTTKDWSGWLSFYEPKDAAPQQKQRPAATSRPAAHHEGDDIPF